MLVLRSISHSILPSLLQMGKRTIVRTSGCCWPVPAQLVEPEPPAAVAAGGQVAGCHTTRSCWVDQHHQVQECLTCLLSPLQVGKRLNVRRERRHVLDVQRAAAAEALRREEEQFDHIKHEFELDNAGIRSVLMPSSSQTKSASGCSMQDAAKHVDSWGREQAAHQPLVLCDWGCKNARAALLGQHSSPTLESAKEGFAQPCSVAALCCRDVLRLWQQHGTEIQQWREHQAASPSQQDAGLQVGPAAGAVQAPPAQGCQTGSRQLLSTLCAGSQPGWTSSCVLLPAARPARFGGRPGAARPGCHALVADLYCTCCQVCMLCVALLQTSASLAPASSAGSPQQQQQSPTAAVGSMARIETRQAATGDTASDWQQNPAAAASVASSLEGLPEGMQRPTLLQAQTYEQVGLLACGLTIHMGARLVLSSGLCCQVRLILRGQPCFGCNAMALSMGTCSSSMRLSLIDLERSSAFWPVCLGSHPVESRGANHYGLHKASDRSCALA